MSEIEGLEVLPSHTNFLLFRTGQDPATLLNALADRGVLVRNMGEVRGIEGLPESYQWHNR